MKRARRATLPTGLGIVEEEPVTTPDVLRLTGRRGADLLFVAAAAAGTAAIAYQGTGLTQKAIEYVVALGAVVLVLQRPGPALAVLAAWLPLSLFFLALLYQYGAPSSVVRGLGGVKDAVTIGVLLAGLRRRPHARWDALDWLAAAYFAWVTIYLLAPFAIHGLLGSANHHVRLLAWRNDVLLVGLFYGARHAPIDPRWRRRLAAVILAVGVILSACAVYEELAPHSWDHFMVSVVGINHYLTGVLGAHPQDPKTVLTYEMVGGHRLLRAGSLFTNPITLPFYLLVPFGLALQALVRGRRSLLAGFATLLLAAALVLTYTRSALVGAGVAIVVVMVRAARRRDAGRLAVGLLTLAAIVVAVPLVFATASGSRLSTAVSKPGGDTAGHISSTEHGLRVAVDSPLGHGLGTVAGIGQRFQVAGTVVAENSYLQIANETGLPAMALFVAWYVVVLRRLSRRSADERSADDARAGPAKRTEGSWVADGTFLGGLALAISGLFLQIFLDYSTALTFWGLAGLVLAAAPRTPSTKVRPIFSQV